MDLLTAEVVGDVFRGHGEGVASDGQVGRNGQGAGAEGNAGIPVQGDGREAFQAGGEGAGGGGSGSADFKDFASTEASPAELQLDGGRGAGDDEGLGFVVGIALDIAQDEPDRVRAVLHIGRGEKTGLPEAVGGVLLHEAGRSGVLTGEVAQGLGKAERKDGDDAGDRRIRTDAEDGVAGTDDARAQQRTGYGEEAGVGRDELVAAREANNLIDDGGSFPFAVDLVKQGADAGLGPEAGEAGMSEVCRGERGDGFDFQGCGIPGFRARGAGGEGEACLLRSVLSDPLGDGAGIDSVIQGVNEVGCGGRAGCEREGRRAGAA